MLKVVHNTPDVSASNAEAGGSLLDEEAGGSLLDEIVREGARQMLAAALQAEVAAYIEAHADQRDELGQRLVVRSGNHAQRKVTTAVGAIRARAPRVNYKRVDATTGERQRFSSAILPAWARKSAQVSEVLPMLYLHGLSTSDFAPALEQLLGTGHGLSPATITRLTTQWQGEARAFNDRSLAETDFVYVWVDGIHLKVRLEQDKVCLLVMIGVRADGTKELIALADGFRESTESWADLLQDRQRAQLLAQVRPARCEEGACRDHRRRQPQGSREGRPGVRGRLRGQVAQGDREGHRRAGRAAGVLRLSRRALDPSAHHQPHRVGLRHRTATAARDQGARLTGRRRGDGLQTPGSRPSPLAGRQRAPPRRARQGRSDLQERQTR